MLSYACLLCKCGSNSYLLFNRCAARTASSSCRRGAYGASIGLCLLSYACLLCQMAATVTCSSTGMRRCRRAPVESR
jgi:hypothetical protein